MQDLMVLQAQQFTGYKGQSVGLISLPCPNS
jgi:hypothetical protein